jgi:hypothetical protein
VEVILNVVPGRSAVRSIAWLDGSGGCSLDRKVTRITGGNVNARSVIESVELILAVVTLRELKITGVAWMKRLVAPNAGAPEPTAAAMRASASKQRIRQDGHWDTDQNGDDPT